MKRTAAGLGVLLAIGLASVSSAAEGEWIQLFNGKNLDGWKVKLTGHELNDNFANTFRVEDGLLKVRYDGYDKFGRTFGHIFYNQPFENYVIRVEYRFVGEQAAEGPSWAFRNSGIMVHGQTPASLRKDQEFPVSIEVQLLGGNGTDERTTGNLCTPGTHVVMNGELLKRHCTNSSSKTYHGDRWVTAEVEVRGNKSIKHFVEGELVLEYTQPQLDESDEDAAKLIEQAGGNKMLSGGSISLQAESHPVDFRKVEVRKLDD
jgi:hypothetical protein